MSSLQGYIEATYDELVKAFGEPAMGPNGDGDKVTCEWEIELDNQTFYIYDWKEEETPMGRYMWHIGGTTRDAERIVQEAFDNPRTGPYARMSNRELARLRDAAALIADFADTHERDEFEAMYSLGMEIENELRERKAPGY